MASFGLAINDWFEKYMFLIVPFVMIIGICFGEPLSGHVNLVPYLFAFVTVAMAIGCRLQQVRDVIAKPLQISYFLILIHIFVPIVVYLLAGLILGYHSPYVVGLVMFTLIPVGISSVMWVSMTGGQVSLVLAIVVIDSLLSPFIITIGLKAFFSSVIEVNTTQMMIDLLLIVVLPTVVGITLNEWSKGTIQSKVKPIVAPLSKLCFVIVILLNASAITPYLHDLKGDIIKIIPFSIIIVIVSYAIGYVTVMRRSDLSTQVTMSYASGIRNVSLGIVIAMSYFSPSTAVPILIGVLLQQPIATLYSLFLQKINKRTYSQSN
ncbi:bile acid:sodium symporter family protein [Paenibacillus endoradicis]|uniref:bile acid:sodium symporter family protein n=1 Tax=Paenibacillus endoradicis TaxID=2972487 RepID=UPI002159B2E1|nr:bile acid:sodium symporter family protein [Paenibacillus endoradicis]MCR8659029.1 bile acid:sodium symporter family protein [Paenibacillus endoradicis]